MRLNFLIFVWFLVFSCLNLGIAKSDTTRDVHTLISQWQVGEARTLLEPLLKASPADIDLRFAHGRLLYFEGRYGDALEVLDAVSADVSSGLPESLKAFHEHVRNTHETLKSFDEFTTEDGRFLIRYSGRDKAILPYIVDVLESADKAFSEDFKFYPKERILVEVYPDIQFLSKVSPLTEEDIETSGTIALCKYHRLMFTSPRALVRGYGWRDTVAHEFVHYYVTKMSKNTVPIWLHEGIAKFQESRWRAAPGAHLDPPQENLLARSLKADKLVTFEQMHPSMAKLPSQEAAGLAFAEVHTVIQYLHRKKGYSGLNQLLENLKNGQDLDSALRDVYGVNLTGLWNVWIQDLRKQGLREFPGLINVSLEFKRPGEEQKTEQDFEIKYESIENKKVRDLTHLGELLRGRERPKAALKEYKKASELGGDGNPMIQNGLAESLIELKRFSEVPKSLERVRSYYPDSLRIRLNLGRAYAALGHTEDAISEFEKAIGINPFHPLIHLSLERLYQTTDNPDGVHRAKQTLELIQ